MTGTTPPEFDMLLEKADQLLDRVQKIVATISSQHRRALHVFLTGRPSNAENPRDDETSGSLHSLERDIQYWRMMIPDELDLRVAIGHRLAQADGFSPSLYPQIFQHLGFLEPQFMELYQQLFSHPFEECWVQDVVEPPRSLTFEMPIEWMDDVALNRLFNSLEHIHMVTGETLFKEGDVGDSLYIIASGRMRVEIEQNGERIVLAEPTRDALLGEMALITNATRSATVYAIRDTELVRLSKQKFDLLIQEYPQVILEITRTIISRLQKSNRLQSVTHVISTITIVPAGSMDDITWFSERLTKHLNHYESTLIVNRQRIELEFGSTMLEEEPDEATTTIITSWLNLQEQHYRFVVYAAEVYLSPWTKICLEQADRIMLVGKFQDLPDRNQIEDYLLQDDNHLDVRKDLVLIHPPQTKHIRNTTNWLEGRPVYRHFHVREANDEDYARLARLLSNRAVGLALSGGGFRGFAHSGVLRALHEMQIPVDVVGGASAGAYVGALLAMGWDVHAIREENKSLLKKTKQFLDYTLPITSIISGNRYNSLLQTMFEDTCIEDLWLPYLCTTSNLTTASAQVHTSGMVWKNVRASSSVGVILPPVLENNHLLVDGGLLNNLPVKEVRELAEGGPVIAVNVTNEFVRQKPYDFHDFSLRSMLWQKINPFSKKQIAPSISDVLLRALEVPSLQSKSDQIQLADVYIRPDVENFGTIDSTNIEQLIQNGYDAAVEALRDFDWNTFGARRSNA